MVSRARAVLRAAAHALAGVAVLLCILLPRSRYDWLRDKGVDPAGLKTSGNAQVALGAIAAVAVALELLALVTARNRRERWIRTACSARSPSAGPSAPSADRDVCRRFRWTGERPRTSPTRAWGA